MPHILFEMASPRSTPRLSASGGEFDARFPQNVFPTPIPQEKRFNCFASCGRQILAAGFSGKSKGPGNARAL